MPRAIFILLPHGLQLGGVTSWATGLVRALRARDLPAFVTAPGSAASLKRIGSTLELNPDWVIALGDLPALDRHPGGFPVWLDACEEALNSVGAGMGPAVWMPQQLGQGLSLGLAMASRQNLRSVWVDHSMIAYNARVAQAFGPWLDAGVGVSSELADRTRRVTSSATLDVRTIVNAVSVSEHPPAEGRRPGPLRLISMGRVEHESKRVLALACVSAELASRGVEHELTVIGDGPAMDDLRAHSTRHMRLMGSLAPEAIGPLLDQSDLFLQASRYEGMSLAMLEAMARGTPPVVTRVESGLEGVLDDGIQGVIANADGETSEEAAGIALADAVERALTLGLDRLSRACWQRARDHHRIDDQAAKFSRLFDDVCARPARAAPPLPPVFGSAGFGTVPIDAGERAARVLAVLRGSRIALHGSGAHTRAVARHLDLRACGVVCIADDNPDTAGGECEGLPVVSPAGVRTMAVTHVVISSHLHEEAIWARRGVYESAGIRVHRLYAKEVSRAADPAA